MTTRIVLVDDHEIVRLGLMTLLEDQPGLQVVGEAGNAADAVKAVAAHRPDVVLMDIRMPGDGGIEATRQITAKHPDTKVVMLTSFADDDLVLRAISAGAVGYVLKQVGNEELLRAIAAAARGEALLDPATTARLLSRVRENERQTESDAFHDLSDQELAVLEGVARGKSNAEIGIDLHLSDKTVRNYLSTVMEKLHKTNRVELAVYAVEHHIFEKRGRE